MSDFIQYTSSEDREYDQYLGMVFELEFGNPKEFRKKSLEILTEIILEKNPSWGHLSFGGFDLDSYQTHQVNNGERK